MEKIYFAGSLPRQTPNLKFKSNLIFHNTTTPTSLQTETDGKLLQSAFYCNLLLKRGLGMKSLGSWGGHSTHDTPISGSLRVPQSFLRGATYQTVQNAPTEAG